MDMNTTSPMPSSPTDEENNGWIIGVAVAGIVIFIVVHILLAMAIIWYRHKKKEGTLAVSES